MTLDFPRFEALTFDCYGTLIDWEAGLLAAFAPVLAAHDRALDDEDLLVRYAAHEARLEAGPYLSYRDVLATGLRGVGDELGFAPTDAEAATFAGSVADWPAFPDSAVALAQLKRRFRLGVLTNCDDDLFAASSERLGVEFDWVVTAQQVGSYKPAAANFEALFERLDVPRDRILHVAQSRFHDHAPAKRLGLTTVWIDRRHASPGAGATPVADAVPDATFPDMASFAAAAAPSAALPTKPPARRPGIVERVGYKVRRLEDRRFDRATGIDVARSVALADLDIPYESRAAGHAYVATPIRLMRMMFASVPGDPARQTFIDLGSGKGRTLFAAVRSGFARAVGVEFAPELHAAAVANVAQYRASAEDGQRIDLVVGDAGDFTLPAGDCVVYFNNPFNEAVMRRVIVNIEAAIERGQRVVVLYQQARIEDDPTDNVSLLQASPRLREMPVKERGPIDRVLLRPYVVAGFESGTDPR